MDNILNSGNSPNLPLSSPRAVAPPLSPDAPSLALPQPVGPPPSANSLPQETRSAPPSPVVTPALAHNAALGQFTKMLLGHTDNYSVVDGKVVNTPTQNKPGDLFRHIMAGVLLGGAAGSGGTGGLAGGAGRGAAAVMQHSEQDRQTKMQQAQNDFERQRQVKEDSHKDAEERRRQSEFEQQQKTWKATNAMNNLNLLQRTREADEGGMSFDNKLAEQGKAFSSPYVAAGIHPLVADLAESQLHDFMKVHPEIGSESVYVTSVVPTVYTDGDGNKRVSSERHYTVYNKNANLPVTKAFLDQGAKYFEMHPGERESFERRGTMTASEMATFHNTFQAANDEASRQLKQTYGDAAVILGNKELTAKIALTIAQTGRENAEAGKVRKDDAEAKALSAAWASFSSGVPPEKMKPDEQTAIMRFADAQMRISGSMVVKLADDMAKNPEDASLKTKFNEASQDYDTYRSIVSSFLKKGVPPPTAKVHPEGKVSIPIKDKNGRPGTIVDPDTIEQTLKTPGITFDREDVAKAGKAYANYVVKPGESALYDEKGDFQGFSPTDSFLGINSAKTLRGLNPGWTSVSKPSEPIKETPYKPSLTHR